VQRIMTTLAVVCNDGATSVACHDPERRTAPGAIEARTIIVAVDNKPAVNVPLGWALSQTTNTRLTTDAADQSKGCVVQSAAYDCLADLVHLDWAIN
jgi:hypothetical protein